MFKQDKILKIRQIKEILRELTPKELSDPICYDEIFSLFNSLKDTLTIIKIQKTIKRRGKVEDYLL